MFPGCWEESVCKSQGYFGSGCLHDGGIDRPVVNQPTKARSVVFFSGMWELLPQRSERFTGEIPNAVWNFVRRVDNGGQKPLAPPL